MAVRPCSQRIAIPAAGQRCVLSPLPKSRRTLEPQSEHLHAGPVLAEVEQAQQRARPEIDASGRGIDPQVDLVAETKWRREDDLQRQNFSMHDLRLGKSLQRRLELRQRLFRRTAVLQRCEATRSQRVDAAAGQSAGQCLGAASGRRTWRRTGPETAKPPRPRWPGQDAMRRVSWTQYRPDVPSRREQGLHSNQCPCRGAMAPVGLQAPTSLP